MTAELQIGTKVRFRGTYRAGGKLDDPDQPHAILTTGTRSKVISLVNGELRREKQGVYSFTMVVEAMARFINVKFCSAQGLGQPFAEQNYRVSDRPSAIATSSRETTPYMAPEQPAVVVDPLRTRMVEALRADGFNVEDSHSDAFVRGAHEELLKRREVEKAKRLREFWSKSR